MSAVLPEIFILFAGIVNVISQARDVVGKSINPYINNVLRVEIDQYSPLERGAGYAQILQTGLYKVIFYYQSLKSASVRNITSPRSLRFFLSPPKNFLDALFSELAIALLIISLISSSLILSLTL